MSRKKFAPRALITGVLVVGAVLGGSGVAMAGYQSYAAVTCQNLGVVGGQTRGTGAHSHAHVYSYLWDANWAYDSASRTRTANSPFDRVYESTLGASSLTSAFRYCTN